MIWEVNMLDEYSRGSLEYMSKEQLILHIEELYAELEKLKDKKCREQVLSQEALLHSCVDT